MARPHGAVRIRGIREVDISQGSIAGTILTGLVGASVDRISAKDGVRRPLSSEVETPIVRRQSRWLLPLIDSSSVRIDGTDSRLSLGPCRFRNAAITSQAIVHEDTARVSALTTSPG